MIMKFLKEISFLIKINEGFRSQPYRCTAGKLTIGYGRNLDDNGITKVEAEVLLHNDIKLTVTDLEDIFGSREFTQLPVNIQIALVDMMFNLGKTRFLGFKKMILAIRQGYFKIASREALDSKWASQVGMRANIDAKLIRGV